eukprot:Blabericola_migrator_1__1068@NODE_1271_length_4925_cov_147_174969_g694_i1_p1_GENE_NODE_1271_length_4925_cov_147_174969_g694_i1NODE_1271_length_4925_cov_147_174969_g694_i1_p1_ORF_typecomplete_len946_score156_24PI3_PI4_kinase/PF00454_27/3_5e41_NODE_1271_length_4925_cov_147_174969_g694_i120874567
MAPPTTTTTTSSTSQSRPRKSTGKSRVASGFVSNTGPITTANSKVKLPSVYQKLGPPFNYSSFSRESHGVLLDDSELQQFIIKQRRCEYFNLVGQFIALIIEVSDKLATEPERNYRLSILLNFLKCLDEWVLARRCIVAASEGIFAMTGLLIPLTHFGVEPERATLGVPTPFKTPFLVHPTPPPKPILTSQFSSVQILRIVFEACKVFSTKKRAPYLLVFELADLDEDLQRFEQEEPVPQPRSARPTDSAIKSDFVDSGPRSARGRTTAPSGASGPVSPASASDSDADVTWDQLYVFNAILEDLKNRQLFIPSFCARPLVATELERIEDPRNREVSCKFCFPPDHGLTSPSPTSLVVPTHSFPFECPRCKGTKVFYEALQSDSRLMALRRCLGVPGTPNARDSTVYVPTVPPTDPSLHPPLPPPVESEEPAGAVTPVGQTLSTPTGKQGSAEQMGKARQARRQSIFASLGLPGASNRSRSVGQDGAAATEDVPPSESLTQQAVQAEPSNPGTPQVPVTDVGFPPLLKDGETAYEQSQRIRQIIWGELWEDMKTRIRHKSPYGHLKSWQLGAVIVKGGDDLRQELLASQLVLQFKAIFDEAKLPLYLRPYEILVTGAHSGIMEFINDTQSIDAIKKKFNVDSIHKVFEAAFADNPSKAKRNFLESHAAYSLIGYFLQVRDRHNANLLLDAAGHIIHIDYGFMLANSPGFMGFETSPFKLSAELLAIMDGETSELFESFKDLIVKGFLETRKHADRIMLVVEMMLSASKLPCFAGNPEAARVALHERFMLGISDNVCISKIVDLIDISVNNWRTYQYDNFQKLTNGIM